MRAKLEGALECPSMTDDPAELAAENLRLTFDLCAVGEAVKWQQLRREHLKAFDTIVPKCYLQGHEAPSARKD